MVSISKIQKPKDLENYISYEDISSKTEIEGTIIKESYDEKEQILKWEIKLPNFGDKILVQKLTKLHVYSLKIILEMLQVEDTSYLIDKPCVFKKTEFRIGYPRFLPRIIQ